MCLRLATRWRSATASCRNRASMRSAPARCWPTIFAAPCGASACARFGHSAGRFISSRPGSAMRSAPATAWWLKGTGSGAGKTGSIAVSWPGSMRCRRWRRRRRAARRSPIDRRSRRFRRSPCVAAAAAPRSARPSFRARSAQSSRRRAPTLSSASMRPTTQPWSIPAATSSRCRPSIIFAPSSTTPICSARSRPIIRSAMFTPWAVSRNRRLPLPPCLTGSRPRSRPTSRR